MSERWDYELDGPPDAEWRPILGLFRPDVPPTSDERWVFAWINSELHVREADMRLIASAPALRAENAALRERVEA